MAESTITRHQKGAITYVLRAFAIAYLFLLVAWPVSLVVTHTFAHGFDALHTIFTTPDLVAALKLSALAATAAVYATANWEAQQSGVQPRLRGISVVSDTVARASGSRGTVSDNGFHPFAFAPRGRTGFGAGASRGRMPLDTAARR